MPRPVTLTALQGMLAQRTSVVYLARILVEHPNLSNPIRLVNDKVNHTDGSSNTWQAFPFKIIFPNDVEETVPTAELVVSNVSRELTKKIRTLSSKPDVTIDAVTDQDFDTVEMGPYSFVLRGYEADAGEIRFTVGPAQDFLSEPFPVNRFLPSNVVPVS